MDIKEKSDVPWDLALLIKDKVIKFEDLSEFTCDLQETVKLLVYGHDE